MATVGTGIGQRGLPPGHPVVLPSLVVLGPSTAVALALAMEVPPAQALEHPWALLWLPVCAISWWWGPLFVSPCEPRGSGDGPRRGPGSPEAAGMAPGCGQDKQWHKEQRGDSGPKTCQGAPRAPIPHPEAWCQELCPQAHLPLPALRCCLLPTYQPVVSLSRRCCVSAPPALVALGGSHPLSPFSPREGTAQQPPNGNSGPCGWDQTQQGSHWGDCGGDKDPAMLVTSTWRALSPPNSCIPPEPVWQGPVQLPRKRHPGWAFPGHALLHSSAESTRRRKDLLEPGAPTVLLVPPKVTRGSQCRWCPPVSHPPARILQKVGKGKKEEAETSEK